MKIRKILNDSFVIGVARSWYIRSSGLRFFENPSMVVAYHSYDQDQQQNSDMDIFNIYPATSYIHDFKPSDYFNKEVVTYIDTNFASKPIWILPSYQDQKLFELAKRKKWKVLANHPSLKQKLDDKYFFREIVSQLGFNCIPYKEVENKKIDNLDFESFTQLCFDRSVVQFKVDNKIKTKFVKTADEFNSLKKAIKTDQKILVSKFIDGPSLTMAGCVTKYGVLHSREQCQLNGEQAVLHPSQEGRYCGNDWQIPQKFPKQAKQMEKFVISFGTYIGKLGYKGIFGIDFMFDTKSGEVFPIECNPRYPGTFPTYSYFEELSQDIILELFHLLEHANQDYDEDLLTQFRNQKRNPINGSQIMVHNKFDQIITIKNEVRPGIYEFQNDELKQQSNSLKFKDLKENQLMINDIIAMKNTTISPHNKLCKIIFPHGVLDENFKLKKDIEEIVSALYLKFLE